MMKKLISAFLALMVAGSIIGGFSSTAFAATVSIPDANLKKALLEECGLASNKQITENDLLKLEFLDFSGLKISNIKGLEYAANLLSLDIGQNSISDLAPIKDLKKLTYLDIGKNNISDLSPLSGMTELRDFKANNNKISDISVLPTFNKVRRINLNDNLGFDLAPFIQLGINQRDNGRDTEMADGGIGKPIPFMKVQSLELQNNKITDKRQGENAAVTNDLANLVRLQELAELDLSRNEISDFSPLAANTKLQYLTVNECGLTDLNGIETLTKLTFLEATDNKLTDISVFSKLDATNKSILNSMEYLTLNNNPSLVNIDPIKSLENIFQVDIRATGATKESIDSLKAAFAGKAEFELLSGKMPVPPLPKVKKPSSIAPKKIKRSTKTISGKTTAGATVKLYKKTKVYKTVIANKSGKFTFKKLNFKKVKVKTVLKIRATKKNYRASDYYTTKLLK